MGIRATTASGTNLPRMSEVGGSVKKIGSCQVEFYPNSPLSDVEEFPFNDRFMAQAWLRGVSVPGIYCIGGIKVKEVGEPSAFALRSFKARDTTVDTFCPRGEQVREERVRNRF